MIIAALSVAAAHSPLGQAPDINVPWLRITFALLACLALALIAILVLRRRQGAGDDLRSLLAKLIKAPGAGTPQLTIEERIRVSAANQILVLRWGEMRYLVHVAPNGAQLLDQLPASRLESTP